MNTDWIVPGAQVAEEKNGYTFTAVKRVTDTMVVLDNGSRYLRDTMRKVGERGPFFGASGPTRLVTADYARSDLARRLVVEAADAVRRRARCLATENGTPAAETLDQMQAAIDEARRKLAELNTEITNQKADREERV